MINTNLTQRELTNLSTHLATLETLSEEATERTEDENCGRLLTALRSGLANVLTTLQPENTIALAMIEDISNIDCEVEQAAYLEQVVANLKNHVREALENYAEPVPLRLAAATEETAIAAN